MRVRQQLVLELLMICLVVLRQSLSIFLWPTKGLTTMLQMGYLSRKVGKPEIPPWHR